MAGSVPLPTSLSGVSVLINGVAAPLFFVSPSQINFQFPWEALGQAQMTITVTASGLTSPPQTVAMTPLAPAIFSINQQGKGQGAILISASGEMAAPAGSVPGRAARPARRGEYISIYCTGLGAVSNPPANGAAAAASLLSSTTTPATVTIGGQPARVDFAGLAPGFVGLYQVNAEVPTNAAAGDAVPVVISIGGASSNTVTIAVQ